MKRILKVGHTTVRNELEGIELCIKMVKYIDGRHRIQNENVLMPWCQCHIDMILLTPLFVRSLSENWVQLTECGSSWWNERIWVLDFMTFLQIQVNSEISEESKMVYSMSALKQWLSAGEKKKTFKDESDSPKLPDSEIMHLVWTFQLINVLGCAPWSAPYSRKVWSLFFISSQCFLYSNTA